MSIIMKVYFKIFFFLFSISCYSLHKDKLFIYNNGNVHIRALSGFDNYGVIKNVEIFGKLAESLSSRLQYKDSIFVDFKHDYTNNYGKLRIVEKAGNFRTGYIWGDLKTIYKAQERNAKEGKQNIIHIYIIGTDFNIIQNLKILEYAIQNNFKNSLNTNDFLNYLSDNNGGVEKVKYYGMSDELIQNILKSKDSKVFSGMINEKITFTKREFIEGYFQNGIYHFKTDNIIFDCKDLVYLIENEISILIFTTSNTFAYINDKTKKINLQQLEEPETESYRKDYAFQVSRAVYLNGNNPLEPNTFILFRPFPKKGYVFSTESETVLKTITYK